MHFLLLLLWLWIAYYAVSGVVQLIWKFLCWVCRQEEPKKTLHQEVVENARRARSTAEETARRVFALYPVREVERARWPVSYRR